MKKICEKCCEKLMKKFVYYIFKIITNLTRIGDCRRLFRDDFTNTIQPTLISVLENYDKMESETVAKVISAITNMLKDDFIRRCVVSGK